MLFTLIPFQIAVLICAGFFIVGLICCFIFMCIAYVKIKSKRACNKINQCEISIHSLQKSESVISIYSLNEVSANKKLNASHSDTNPVNKLTYENERQTNSYELAESINSRQTASNKEQESVSVKTLSELENKYPDSLNSNKYIHESRLDKFEFKVCSNGRLNTAKKQSSISKQRSNSKFEIPNVDSKYMLHERRSPLFKNYLLKSEKPFLGYVPKMPVAKK